MNTNISLDHNLCRYLPNLMVIRPDGKKRYYTTLEVSNGNILFKYRTDETVININQLTEECELGRVLNLVGYIKALKDAYYNQEVDDYQHFNVFV